jgi:hypothetical protein
MNTISLKQAEEIAGGTTTQSCGSALVDMATAASSLNAFGFMAATIAAAVSCSPSAEDTSTSADTAPVPQTDALGNVQH